MVFHSLAWDSTSQDATRQQVHPSRRTLWSSDGRSSGPLIREKPRPEIGRHADRGPLGFSWLAHTVISALATTWGFHSRCGFH